MQTRYIYCIIDKELKKSFGKIGIDDCIVYSIPYDGFSVIMHEYPAERLKKKDKTDLAVEHEYVILDMMERFGIIPFNPGFAIKEERVQKWVERQEQKIRNILEKNKEKEEFAVQILYNPNPKIRKTAEEKELKEGVGAYMEKQRRARTKTMKEIAENRDIFYNQIKRYADDIKIRAAPKSLEGGHMVLDLSCLVHKNMCKELEGNLRKINSRKEFSVILSGPLPPYSFV